MKKLKSKFTKFHNKNDEIGVKCRPTSSTSFNVFSSGFRDIRSSKMAATSELDLESYWNSSKISDMKGHNFDDLDVNSIASCNGEDSILQKVEEPDRLQSARFRSSTASSSSASSSSSWTVVADQKRGVSKVSGNSTFYDEPDVNDKQLSLTEAAKLESEVMSLRRALEDATKDRWTVLPPKQMIRRIIMGKPYNFGDYKSKEMKLKLLDFAVESNDGNAILAVVLFLKNTLKQTLFYQELMKRSEAIDHYILYLKSQQEFAELSDLLSLLDRGEEAALLNYRLSLRSRSISMRVSSLKNCITNHFLRDPSRSLVDEHVFLLEIQRPLQVANLRKTRDGSSTPTDTIPLIPTLLNASLIETLHYCCLYCYDASESTLSSPGGLRKRFQLTDKQFHWTAMEARAQLKCWHDLDSLVLTKSWLPNSKKFVIDPEKVLEVLQKNSADPSILNNYAKMIENVDNRLEVATRFKCHEVVINALVQLRDRQRLIAYGPKILPHSKEYFYHRDALNNSTVKWKN